MFYPMAEIAAHVCMFSNRSKSVENNFFAFRVVDQRNCFRIIFKSTRSDKHAVDINTFFCRDVFQPFCFAFFFRQRTHRHLSLNCL